MTSRDIPLLIKSASASSERRITPSWTITQLKQKLETVTGISPSSQKLLLNLPGGQKIPLEADDEDSVQLARWDLIPYAEIEVCMAGEGASRGGKVWAILLGFVFRLQIIIFYFFLISPLSAIPFVLLPRGPSSSSSR
jgi:hypothetical protein